MHFPPALCHRYNKVERRGVTRSASLRSSKVSRMLFIGNLSSRQHNINQGVESELQT
jgi:hypothetical protein